MRVRAVRVLDSGKQFQVGPLILTDVNGGFRLDGIPAVDLRLEAITDAGPVDVGEAPLLATDGVYILN
jgi:hypothetical protein